LVWIKVRSNAVSHALTDSVRGISSILSSDLTSAEATQSAGQGLTAFNSNGFSLGTQCAGAGDTNFNGRTYVGWQWQAGQGSTSSNTNGTITSTVSVNASAGFSVVTYAAQASGTATIGHGLGVAPSLIILKSRVSAYDWAVYHASLGNTAAMRLNLNTFSNGTSAWWNNTSPTSTVFTVGINYAGAGNTVAYCWTPIAGFSAFGSYTGNDSNDGPFVYLGFRPKFVLFKTSSTTSAWMILDSVRDSYNVEQYGLAPNNSNAESTYSGIPQVDFLSNGFKIRANNANSYWNNSSGSTNIYAAFAENPFKNALAR
jgi:hypothetical protein